MRGRFALALVAVLAFGVGGYAGGRMIQTPAQAQEELAAPEPSPLAVPVEERELESRLIVRATVERPGAVAVPTPDLADGIQTVVVELARAAGEVVEEGDVLAVVADRPVVVLRGAVPMFREVAFGDEGSDVRQIQQALTRLGFRVGEIDGVYGPQLRRGLEDFYAALGAQPLQAGTGQEIADVAKELAKLARPRSTAAKERKAELERKLHELEAPVIPRGELAFVPATPLHVAKYAAGVGETAGTDLATLAPAGTRLVAAVAADEAALLAEGMVARVDDPVLGLSLDGTVASIVEAAAPAGAGGETGAAGARSFEVAVTVADPGPLQAHLGSSLRVVVPIRSTEQEVLVVPVAALFTRQDGVVYVDVLDRGPVPVVYGLEALGYVEVRPAQPGGLAAGDHVVVGAPASLPAEAGG